MSASEAKAAIIGNRSHVAEGPKADNLVVRVFSKIPQLATYFIDHHHHQLLSFLFLLVTVV
jgi:hypothetical protein